jgi:hypothetical protein
MTYVSINSGSNAETKDCVNNFKKKIISLNLESKHKKRIGQFDKKEIITSLFDWSLSCKF